MGKDNPCVAVIGAGYWGKNLVRNFYNLGALKTICDSNQVLMEKMMTDYPGVKAAANLAEVLTDEEVGRDCRGDSR